MPALRTKCLSTKLTEGEFATLEALAGSERLSSWARENLLDLAYRRDAFQVLLAEFLALRTIVLNLHFALGRGEMWTADAVQRLIDRADEEKLKKAQTRLEGARRPS